MGSSCSTASVYIQMDEIVAMARSRKIEEALSKEEAQKSLLKEMKMLLLGAGECGKSTIVKQMKIIHDKGYSMEEREMFRDLVFSNVVHSLYTIVINMEGLGIQFGEKENLIVAESFCQNAEEWIEKGILTFDAAQKMQRIWLDSGVQICYGKGSEYGLGDSAAYFLNALDRISIPNYIPTEQDLLRTRTRTTGIVEIQFRYKGLNFRMLDVGGQRSERKKWIHCFDEAKAVIFVAALSDYDLTLSEDPSCNRMKESLRLFNSICNNKWFVTAAMIVFLNKSDLFLEKLNKRGPVTIRESFPDYPGDPYDYNDTTNYIQEAFVKENKNPDKDVYIHLTCATNTNNINFVFSAVTDMLIRENLQFCGLY